MQQPIGRLMLQASFGRTALNRPSLFLAKHYRLGLGILIIGLLAAHLLLSANPIPLIAGVVTYIAYLTWRLNMPLMLERRFYTRRVQYWRAQVSIAGVTILMVITELFGSAGSLWILYTPALFLISRYCVRHRTYLAVAGEVALLAAGLRWFELRSATIALIPLLGELLTRMLAVILPSFLVHYLVRVHITVQEGAKARDQVVQQLLERTVFETDALALWWSVRDACFAAVPLVEARLYLCDHEWNRIQLIEDAADGYTLGQIIKMSGRHLAARAVRYRQIAADDSARVWKSAIPIYGHPDDEEKPLAVLEVTFPSTTPHERYAAQKFLINLLQQIWPICAYANVRHQFPLFKAVDTPEFYSLDLDKVLSTVLEAICNTLGFAFAMISLVNEDQQEIGAVRAKNVPEGWVADSHHPLDSHDIQADVLRTGRIEVLGAWDSRFDERIWTKYNHVNLVRVWVPLGTLGIIEAGFSKRDRAEIPSVLIEMLKRYARDVTAAIRNAQLYQREQRHASTLARLNHVSYEFQTFPRQRDDARLLQQITEAALTVLDASVVMLYPLSRDEDAFTLAICAGTILGQKPLAQPNTYPNIVRHIADMGDPYYQPDAQRDPLLVGAHATDSRRKRPKNQPIHRTFTVRQGILSFAGVPLLAYGEVLGVLCVNFRKRHQFSPNDRLAIQLFAQQAAAAIASGRHVREQERRWLQYDLHDAVKSSLRGMILLSKAATRAIESDPRTLKMHLHDIRHAAWNTLADVDLVLHDLGPRGYDGRDLSTFIGEDLRRLVGQHWSKLELDLDRDLPALPMTFARHVLCLLREAVINALEHAAPHTIRVRLGRDAGVLHLSVDDDGSGFDLSCVAPDMHRGLAIMRERADMMGGELEITSRLGYGTAIRLVVSCKEITDDHTGERDG